MEMFKKIENLVNKLSSDLQERDEAIKLSLLALLSGESIFLLGPPGVAKSLLARKIKESLLEAKEFEYLMNRFSTPEELFGPVSLVKLEEDKYERKIEGYLPDSEIIFLDEIWKASPSIQNTLLTVINERIFKNGTETLTVPLKLLIAASNELPAEGEGLEALYDRFLIRLFVNNVSDKEKFRILIDNTNKLNNIIADNEKLTYEELKDIKENASKIILDDTSFSFIVQLKEKLTIELKESSPYISDRRWKKIVSIIKTNAYVSGRDKIALGDLLLIENLIWETPDQYEKIRKIVLDCWINAATLSTGFTIDDAKESLKQIEESYSEAYTKKIVPFQTIKNESMENYRVFVAATHPEYKYWAFPEEPNNNYKYIYAWKSKSKIKSKIMNYDREESHYNLPKIESDGGFSFGNFKFETYCVEKIKINTKKMEIVKDSLASTSKMLSRLADKKEGIISDMKSIKNLLVNSYEYNIDCFDSKMDELIDEYSNKRDDLLFKIKSSLIDEK